MPMSDFILSLLFEADEIFGSDEFPESGSNFMIVSNFFSICCFFLGLGLLKDKAIFCLADCTISNAVSTFLATLSSNFFRDTSSALTLFLSLSRAFFTVASTFFATASAFLVSLFCA